MAGGEEERRPECYYTGVAFRFYPHLNERIYSRRFNLVKILSILRGDRERERVGLTVN